MERNSNFMSTTFKNHSIYGGSSTSNNNSNKALIRDSWGNIGESSVVGGDLFSWPPRSYTCSFCKREFKSAQALGGHMNVHRRDRARLRSSPPRNGQFSIFNLNLDPNQNLNPNPNPNPNPNFLSSSSSCSPSSILMFRQPFTSNLPPLASSPISNLSNSVPSEKLRWCRAKRSWVDHLSPHSGDNLANLKTTKALFEVGNFDGFLKAGKESDDVVKTSEILRLNLEIGMLSDSKNDLDLELRLGYS